MMQYQLQNVMVKILGIYAKFLQFIFLCLGDFL